MTITLSPEVEKLVRDRIACGDYDSPDALVGAAVRRLVEEDAEEECHQEQVRARIAAAESEIDRGDYVEYDTAAIDELAKDVHRRGPESLRR